MDTNIQSRQLSFQVSGLLITIRISKSLRWFRENRQLTFYMLLLARLRNETCLHRVSFIKSSPLRLYYDLELLVISQFEGNQIGQDGKRLQANKMARIHSEIFKTHAILQQSLYLHIDLNDLNLIEAQLQDCLTFRLNIYSFPHLYFPALLRHLYKGQYNTNHLSLLFKAYQSAYIKINQNNVTLIGSNFQQFYEQIIMQQLVDILTHKLTLINQTNADLTNSQKDELLDQLIVQKKKEGLRILVQTRLQQTIDSKMISDTEQIHRIITKVHKVMCIRDPLLPIPEREDPLASLVELFHIFFNRQNCSNRAQEIINMYKKKLCPRGMLPSTLFNWFVEWTRKQFQEHLKTTIHSLYVDSRQLKTHRQSQKGEDQKPDNPFLIIQKKEALPNSKMQAPSQPLTRRQMHSLQDNVKRLQKERVKSQSPSEKSIKFPSIQKIEQDLPINKEVFYYAYSEEIHNLYRQLEVCIPDLDIGFVRGLRRGGVRRNEVKRRVKEVASNIIKHMVHIKQGIEKYYKQFSAAHQPEQAKKGRKKRRTITLESQCENSNRTSQGIRTISTSKHIEERRGRIISSFAIITNRYDSQQQESNSASRSNLLPIHNLASPKRKITEHTSNTIDLSVGNFKHQQPKILVLNSASISPNLQIIEEKRQRIKGKNLKKIIRQNQSSNKKQIQKTKLSKSIHLKDSEEQERGYHSIDISASSHLHLPKIRRLK